MYTLAHKRCLLPFIADRAKESDGDDPAERREDDRDDNHVSAASSRPGVNTFPRLS